MDEFSLTLPEKKILIFLWVPCILTTCCPVGTFKEQKKTEKTAFLHNKIITLVSHFGWCGILYKWIIAGSIFILSSANALCCICITSFDQDMAFSNVNNSEEQAKYKQEMK